MTTAEQPPPDRKHRERFSLAVIAACCAGPMLIILVLTGVLGVAIGPAVAISLGAVAAGVCVALTATRHRGHRDRGADQ